MCKVMMIAGIKKQNLPKVHKLVVELAKAMSFIEDDGVGYAAITKTGEIYGEKWLNKEDAFKIHSQPKINPAISIIENLFDGSATWVKAPVTEKVYESYGKKAVDDTVAIILHARKKTTGEKTIENTHPFFDIEDKDSPATALIHNGSIVNHASLTKKTSTCDSEVILHEYLSNQAYYNPHSIHTIAKTLVGEYAVGVLSSVLYEDGKKQPILDVFKSHKNLYAGYVKEIECTVFCTSDMTLNNAVKTAQMNISNMVEFNDGHFLRIDATSGERCEDIIKFETSRRFEGSDYYGPNYNPNKPYSHGYSNYDRSNHHGPKNLVVIPKETEEETIEGSKANFSRKHSDLFTQKYHGPDMTLTAEEVDYFEELGKMGTTNMRALKLVEKILNIKQ